MVVPPPLFWVVLPPLFWVVPPPEFWFAPPFDLEPPPQPARRMEETTTNMATTRIIPFVPVTPLRFTRPASFSVQAVASSAPLA